MMNKFELQQRTDDGIEERKKRIQDKHEMTHQLREMVKVFGEQAVVDEIFRNNKIWFSSESSEEKWEELWNELRINGLMFSQK